jgi:hypothetical protein
LNITLLVTLAVAVEGAMLVLTMLPAARESTWNINDFLMLCSAVLKR